MESEDMSDDDDSVYAPLVDGLSGATCVLLLVLISFMAIMLGLVQGKQEKLHFIESTYRPDLDMVIFGGSFNLDNQERNDITNSIIRLEKPTIYIYMPLGVYNRREKMTFNIVKFISMLKLGNTPIKIEHPDISKCPEVNVSCIYWR